MNVKGAPLRSAVALAALLVLSACDVIGAFDGTMNLGESNDACENRALRDLASADFSTAASVEMVIRRGEFEPMILRLAKGRAYNLRLRNRDQSARAFNAPEFFDSIAVAAAALDNDILKTLCPGPVIVLQPGQSFEMQFLAVVDGVYEYGDHGGGLAIGNLLNTAPPGGLIRIEETY